MSKIIEAKKCIDELFNMFEGDVIGSRPSQETERFVSLAKVAADSFRNGRLTEFLEIFDKRIYSFIKSMVPCDFSDPISSSKKIKAEKQRSFMFKILIFSDIVHLLPQTSLDAPILHPSQFGGLSRTILIPVAASQILHALNNPSKESKVILLKSGSAVLSRLPDPMRRSETKDRDSSCFIKALDTAFVAFGRVVEDLV